MIRVPRENLTVGDRHGFYVGMLLRDSQGRSLEVVAVSGFTITVRPARWWRRAWRWCRNRARRLWWRIRG